MRVSNMLKSSKFTGGLLVSASVFSILCMTPAQAKKSAFEEDNVISKITAVPKMAVEAIKAKGTAYVKNQAEAYIDANSNKIAKAATQKLHTLFYRHANIHVVNNRGEHIGWVEDLNSNTIRNFVKNTTGFDLNGDIPGVPAFMAKALNNVLENQVRDYFEQTVQASLKEGVTNLTMKAVRKGMGLAEDAAVKANESSSASAKVVDISSQLRKASEKPLEDKELSIMTELATAITAKFKSAINSFINQTANETAEYYIKQAVNSTGEAVLRKTETGTATAAITATGLLTGPYGLVIASAALHSDSHTAEVTKEMSYLRQAVKYITGFDKRKDDAEKKILNAAQNQINGGSNFFKISSKESDLLEGTFAHEEIEDDFVNLVRTKAPYSVNTFATRVGEAATTKAVETAKYVANKANNAAKNAKETMSILPDSTLDKAFSNFDLDGTSRISAPQAPAKKAWYKIW